jgi:aromatic-L-amino-acid decarboxylase
MVAAMRDEDFRRLGHALVDWIADYRASIERRPVMSQAAPGDVRKLLPAEPPEQGDGLFGLLEDLEQIILPGITHWNHPRFFAYFPSNTDLSSVLADLVCAGLGAQAMSWQTSPAATELEQTVLDWLRQLVGLSPAWTGSIHDTASTATLVALLSAREKAGGLARGPLVVYASEQAHSSVEKAALLAGFGRANFKQIPTDDAHALDPRALDAEVERDVTAGRRPCAIVATCGTTATCALDPIKAAAATAEKHGMWLHVDAALAGDAMILPECRWMWDGVERADSMVMNPHKWLGVGFDLSAYYVRDPEHLVRVMSTSPSYLRTAQDGAVVNFRDWGIPLGRRFRALKLWFLLRGEGAEVLRARLRRDLENARWLADKADRTKGWQRLAPVLLQTVCLRRVPPDAATEEEIDRANLALVEAVNRGGRAYLTPSVIKGKQAFRVSIGALGTERRHVEELWALLNVSPSRAI